MPLRLGVVACACWVVACAEPPREPMVVVAAGSGGSGGVTGFAAGGGAGTPAILAGMGGLSASGSGGSSGNAVSTGGTGGSPGVSSAGMGPMIDGGAPDAGDASAPPVELPDGLLELFPLPDAQLRCVDPQLRIGFSSPPKLGTSGRVRVWNDAETSEPVATIDLAAGVRTQVIGGAPFELPPAAYVDGNTAVFVLPGQALARERHYHVTIEEGVLEGPDGSYTIDDATTWRFQTLAEKPIATDKLKVGLSENAEYCSVQGALDAVPANNQTPLTIEIANGSYFGVVYFQQKHQLTLRGQHRERTVIVGINNNDLNPSTKSRALFGADDVSDLTIENLTIHNLTPQDGSQAEALRLQTCTRCRVRDADVLSLQDTLLWSGTLYAENCLIAGNVDFVWGTGAAYFNACEIRTVGRAGYVVQARNGSDGHGYVFVDSRITSDEGIRDSVLARIDASDYPSSQVAYIDCEIGAHISRAGWLVSRGSTAGLRFGEYRSRDASGALIDVSGRAQGSRQLTDAEAAMLRDPSVVLDGWQP